jgi:hypothetical protein
MLCVLQSLRRAIAHGCCCQPSSALSQWPQLSLALSHPDVLANLDLSIDTDRCQEQQSNRGTHGVTGGACDLWMMLPGMSADGVGRDFDSLSIECGTLCCRTQPAVTWVDWTLNMHVDKEEEKLYKLRVSQASTSSASYTHNDTGEGTRPLQQASRMHTQGGCAYAAAVRRTLHCCADCCSSTLSH